MEQRNIALTTYLSGSFSFKNIFKKCSLTVSALFTVYTEKALETQLFTSFASGQVCSWSASNNLGESQVFLTGRKVPRDFKQQQDDQFGQFPKYYCDSPWYPLFSFSL